MSEHAIGMIMDAVLAGLTAGQAGVTWFEGDDVNLWNKDLPAGRVFDGNEIRDDSTDGPFLAEGQWRRFLMLHVDLAGKKRARRDMNNLAVPVEAFFSKDPALGDCVESVRLYSKTHTTEKEGSKRIRLLQYVFRVVYYTDYRDEMTYPPVETINTEGEEMEVLPDV